MWRHHGAHRACDISAARVNGRARWRLAERASVDSGAGGVSIARATYKKTLGENMASMFSNQSTGVIAGLKERLNFGKKNNQYDSYGQLEDSYDNEYGEYEDAYDEYDEYDNEYASGEYNDQYALESGASLSDKPASSGYDASTPRLITLDDVKASTQKMTAERYGQDASAPSRKRITVSSNDAYDKMANAHVTGGGAGGSAGGSGAGFGASAGVSGASSASGAATSASGSRVAGKGVSAGGFGASGGASTSGAGGTKNHAPHERSAGLNSLFEPSASASRAQSRRSVQVIKPQTYNDVAPVADVLRGGGVAVLHLAQTPEGLQNRVLDFSFGVASALDAHVDSLASNAYAITCGDALSQAERASLATQGIGAYQ